MADANKPGPVTPVETEEQLTEYLKKSNDLLIVIDIHQSWSGPTETLTPTLTRLLQRIESCETRLQTISCALPKFATLLQTLQSDDSKFGDLSVKGCSPLFVAVRFGKGVGMVEGCNGSAVEGLVLEQIPDYVKDEQ